ncbi:unnamed protein product [Gordionus sp. m RMFG-2023]|uniref:uncharacterized protein LOC135928017 n=1 Tax=Gordionus sp. m RMFG-2023 TaxID=3053472 RepID=UPI0030E2E050
MHPNLPEVHLCYLKILVLIIFVNLCPLCHFQAIQYPEIPWSKNDDGTACIIPETMRGSWYLEERGSGTSMKITHDYIQDLGKCVKMRFNDGYSVYRNTFLFKSEKCKTCVSIVYRTQNVLEYKKLECIDDDTSRTMVDICAGVDVLELITMFALTPTPVNCRSSMEGVFKFEYRYSSQTGYCRSPDNKIRACQRPGTHFSAQNERFYMNYSRCDSVVDRIEDDPYATSNKQGSDRYKSANIIYSCLGQWELTNGNVYFAVANLGESQLHLKYRCFLTRRDQPLHMTKSSRASCSELRNAREGPEMLRLTQMEFSRVLPTCHFPKNFSGNWINTANYDSRVVINSTHIYEENLQNQMLLRKTYYVCKESMGNYYLTARLSYSGCQIDYVCWDFQNLLPSYSSFSPPTSRSDHHQSSFSNSIDNNNPFNSNPQSTSFKHNNILRYRVSSAIVDNRFDQVCQLNNFQQVALSNIGGNGIWKYSTLLAESRAHTPCPIQGRYRFEQKGQTQLDDRIIGGITAVPEVRVTCNNVESELRVCSKDASKMLIDVHKCVSLDSRGKPLGEFDKVDYEMSCIGYWREDSLSYLITYDENDSASRYRCWVYLRTHFNTIIMSRSIQSYCGVNQLPNSWNASEGASLYLKLIESERQFDNCPMRFNPGDTPNKISADQIILLNSALTIFKMHLTLYGILLSIFYGFFIYL